MYYYYYYYDLFQCFGLIGFLVEPGETSAAKYYKICLKVDVAALLYCAIALQEETRRWIFI